MKLGQIAAAFPALKRIGNIEMDFRDAYELHKLIKTLQQEYDFYFEQEMKIVRKYSGVLDMNSPVVKFPNEKVNLSFLEERKKLGDTEIKTETMVIKITVNESMRILANDIAALTPFIEFEFIE